ncbi:GlsB/YeaQ/YmgE family stress response membrane protein [Ensifer adhaerens]|uniref:GlsB/YeaQ/YmgE family stress response membrane protein n=1 Tax=Ensifer adhaerens TaxID=106592 RepID=UPI003D030C6F
MPTAAQIIVWIIVGLLAGSLTSRLITWDKAGFGRGRNLGLGLAGAFVGGLLFRMFGWWPQLDLITVSLRDIVAAVIGSLIVLGAWWIYRRSTDAGSV